MTEADLANFKSILKRTEAGVYAALRRRDGIAVERSPDTSDEAQYAVDRELSVRFLDNESRLLAAIRLALQRVDEGIFGVCERCEAAIGPSRLAAVPWTCYCIRCQERVENDRQEYVVPSPRSIACSSIE